MTMDLLLVGVFLPLFPMSMLFNLLFERVRNAPLRILLLLMWPLIGIFLLQQLNPQAPAWLSTWALLTALLYAWRLLAMRELALWTGFLATSVWSLLWLSPAAESTSAMAYLPALWFSVPMALLVAVAAILQRRFGAAFAGLYGGLALNVPRLSSVLVLALLASIATPVFPAFFVMLKLLIDSSLPLMIGVLLTWLLWSWAAAIMIQGLLVGPARDMPVADMKRASGFVSAAILVLLVVAGMTLSGSLL